MQQSFFYNGVPYSSCSEMSYQQISNQDNNFSQPSLVQYQYQMNQSFNLPNFTQSIRKQSSSNISLTPETHTFQPIILFPSEIQVQSPQNTNNTTPLTSDIKISSNILEKEESQKQINIPYNQWGQRIENATSYPFARISSTNKLNLKNEIQIISTSQENPEKINSSQKSFVCGVKQINQLPPLSSQRQITFVQYQFNEITPIKQLQMSGTDISLNQALKQTGESVFNQNHELIFSSKYVKQFQMKQSQQLNEEIVFSKMKEFRMKKDEEGNDEKKSKSSKFHNLNKLFMYRLLATLSQRNIINLQVPKYLHDSLKTLIQKIKLSTKQMKQFCKRTEFFSHDHYNLLFLHLNKKTISYLQTSSFAVYLHKLCFNLDLEQLGHLFEDNATNNQSFQSSLSFEAAQDFLQKVQYTNIMKRFCCQIVQSSNMIGDQLPTERTESISTSNNLSSSQEKFIENIESQPGQEQIYQLKDNAPQQKQKIYQKKVLSMREAYTKRALKGIQTLNEGVVVKRF